MDFYRIEPLQLETFYVLAAEPEDLRKIVNNPVCFSPVNYRIEPVEPGDMPAHSKIVVIDDLDHKIRRVNLETAMQIHSGEDCSSKNEISAAIETLKMALQRNGLSAPVRIELQDSDQALKLAELFGDKVTTKVFRAVASRITGSTEGFAICGISFSWKQHQPIQLPKFISRLRYRLGLK